MTAIPKEYTSRDEAIADCVHCEHCNLTGLVTLFHRQYNGEPTIEVRNHNGELRKTAARIIAHCVCPVGRWARGNVSKDISLRVPDMHQIIQSKTTCWQLSDPTMPDFDPQEEPDWKGFRKWLAEQPRPIAQHVSPSPERT